MNECFYNLDGYCSNQSSHQYTQKCMLTRCKLSLDIPRGIHDTQNKELMRAFQIIVKAFEDAGFKLDGGSSEYALYSKPKIKMFLRDIKGIDKFPWIMIRHW